MVPTFLLLLWLQGGFSGPPVQNTYTRVQHLEGETLSVQCHYKNHKNRVDGKVWCRVRRNRCEAGFTRVWAQQPHYLLEDDAQAKVVTITMAALRRQDSGRYWCMRNSSQILYPLMGIQLEVYPAPTTERHVPLTRLPKGLESAVVLTKGRASTADPDTSFTSTVTVLTPGLLTLARPLPSTAPGTTGQTPVAGHSFPDTASTTRGHRRQTEPWRATASPSNAQGPSVGPAPIATPSGPPRTNLPTSTTSGSPRTSLPTTTGILLYKLPPIRHKDFDPTVLAVALAFVPVLVLAIIFFGVWKRRRRVGSECSPFPTERRDCTCDCRLLASGIPQEDGEATQPGKDTQPGRRDGTTHPQGGGLERARGQSQACGWDWEAREQEEA